SACAALLLTKAYRILGIDDHCTPHPQDSVNTPHAEGPQDQPGHHDERPEQHRVMDRITIVPVSHEPHEGVRSTGVTLAAGLSSVLLREPRLWIRRRQNAVRAMAIEACGNVEALPIMGATVIGF